MMTPDDIDVWAGLDVGKSAHHAHALDRDGDTLYDKPVRQDEKAIRSMLGKLSKHGRVLLVVDQPNTIGSLPLTVARNMGIAVAYLPGTAMRRTAQLLPGDAKTDRRDAHVIAWAALKLPECLCSISCCGFSHDDFSGLGRACRPRNGLNWMVLVSPPERTGKDYDQHAPSTVYPSFAAERGIRRVDRAENTCQRADGA